jgi:hypothetical protein
LRRIIPRNQIVSESNLFEGEIPDKPFDEYTEKDWKKYFYEKGRLKGIRVQKGEAYKEASIFKSLMKRFKPFEIKDMIDFMWDAPHDFFKKEFCTPFLISKNWVSKIYNGMLLWKAGKPIGKVSGEYTGEITGRNKVIFD